MIKRHKKFPNAIPLEALLLDDNFMKSYLLMAQEPNKNHTLFAALTEEMKKKMKDGVRYGEAQAGRRKGQTKLSESQKRQIVREYEAAVVKYGAIKRLAGQFDVSDETISGIVKPKPIPKKD